MWILPARSPADDADSDADSEGAAWAASGAMELTGRADGPALGPPAGLVTGLRALGARLATGAAALGGALAIDPLALLGERAAIAGLHRRGATSCGGATRLLPCREGWFAMSLTRPDDVALVPAWLELAEPLGDPWATVERAVATRSAAELLERARWLGLPAATIGAGGASNTAHPRATRMGTAEPTTDLSAVTVVELASLWAGPLCGSLLAAAGADVVKVESTQRPDGARRGPPAFFDLLNAGKRSVAVDLGTAAGVSALHALVARADVVIEGSRPRALEQLGIDATAMLANGRPRAWVSITGHGRAAPGRDWVAFGDDAAVAGGLVVWDDRGPVFCADAVADPIAGVVAAVAALEALASRGRFLLDVPLSGVAAHFAGPTRAAGTAPAIAPVARVAPAAGPRLGEHTDELLAGRGPR